MGISGDISYLSRNGGGGGVNDYFWRLLGTNGD